ncbi:L,D-transpeptidase [Plastorhodobacter daqingensis]|uniref:L,D-transpeptidase n=1 Tax=Plastorhodobacter daqingensis TaxID=1387281 RepID=A0ABW2UFH9_9RHOB
MNGELRVTRWGCRFHGRHLPCAIGRGGITGDKREGDGASPRGTHRIMGMMFRPDRLPASALPLWARPIGPADLWSDDPGDPCYNHLVRAPHGHSHERLRRGDPMYDLVLVTDWNWPEAQPGAGSAIFVHQWRRPRYPTAGCVAFRRDHLLWVAARVTLGTRLVIS